jgi:hypothetical protein
MVLLFGTLAETANNNDVAISESVIIFFITGRFHDCYFCRYKHQVLLED